MFIGRDAELGELEQLHAESGFRFAEVTGAPGIGKTALLREFCRNKRAVMFSAVRADRMHNLVAMSRAVSKSMYRGLRRLVSFASFEDAFTFICKLSERERVVLVIDNYDFFRISDDPVSDAMRVRMFADRNIMLVISGNGDLEEGRRFPEPPEKVELGPLRFSEVRNAYDENYTDEDLLTLFSVTGGYPDYLRHFDPAVPLRQGIIDCFLQSDGPLYRPPLERTSIRNPETYNCILSAMGDRMVQMGEITESSGVGSSAACSTYLSALVSERVAEKLHPFGEAGSRRSLYRISDPVARFWYSFIEDNQSIVDFSDDLDIYQSIIGDGMEHFLQATFREVCLQFMRENSAFFDMRPGRTGMWWGHDSTRSMGRIDIVAESDDMTQTMFCDCRFRDSPVGMSVLDGLREKSRKVRSAGVSRYALFSKNGFTQELLDYAEENDVTLVTLRDICWY